MLRIVRKPYIALGLIILCAAPAAAVAAPPADTLLPATTKAFFSAAKFPDADARWHKTRLGQLIADPALDPFFEDLRRQMREKWFKNKNKIGTTFQDFEQAASGEVAVALIHTPRTNPATAILADVTGRVPQAQQLLAKVAQDMINQQGRQSRVQVAGVSIEAFEFPPDEAGQPPQHAYYTIASNLLVGADEISAMNEILRRLAAPATPNALAQFAPYQAVVQRASRAAKDNNPHARWFVEPIGLMAAIEADQPQKPKPGTPAARPATNAPPSRQRPGTAAPAAAPQARKKTQSELARELGFGAIQGAGGFVYMPDQRYDFLSYTSVYAPKPWQKSMNVLAFPNATALGAEPWVPADVAMHVAFNIDVKTAEANFEPLFDQLFGEGEQGVWTDVKDSLRDDPNGPKVDLVKDLINHLGQRATFITDYITPITPTSERTCLGIVAVDPKALAEGIRKSMATDPNVKHRQFRGFDIWEMTEESVSPPEVEIEDPNRPQPVRQPVRSRINQAERDQAGEEGEEPQQRYFPKSAVTVARGFLFIASHVDFLEKILSQEESSSLASRGDYQAISKEMQSLGANQVSFEVFVRQALAVRPTYELIRVNKLPEAQTLLATALNRILTKQGEQNRASEIDGSKLPPFEQVQRYFDLSGMYVTTEANGWLAVGFSPKEPQARLGSRSSAAGQKY